MLKKIVDLFMLDNSVKNCIKKDPDMLSPDIRCFHFLKWEIELIRNGWEYIGCGRHRRVIRRNNAVIKIPYRYNGIEANIAEHHYYREYRRKNCNRNYYAPCRLLKNKCLLMWYVHPMETLAPDWAKDLLDGPQVGRRNNGRIFTYDYADEVLSANIKTDIQKYVTQYSL